jgi:hypothetical protein
MVQYTAPCLRHAFTKIPRNSHRRFRQRCPFRRTWSPIFSSALCVMRCQRKNFGTNYSEAVHDLQNMRAINSTAAQPQTMGMDLCTLLIGNNKYSSLQAFIEFKFYDIGILPLWISASGFEALCLSTRPTFSSHALRRPRQPRPR